LRVFFVKLVRHCGLKDYLAPCEFTQRSVLDLALNKSASEKDLFYARRVVLSDEDIYIAGAAREGIAVCGLRKDCSLYHGERDLAFFKSAKDLAA